MGILLYDNLLRRARVIYENKKNKGSILNKYRPIYSQDLRTSVHINPYERLSFEEIKNCNRMNKPLTHVLLFNNRSMTIRNVYYSFKDTLSDLEYARDNIVLETEESTGTFRRYQLFCLDNVSVAKRLRMCRGIKYARKSK